MIVNMQITSLFFFRYLAKTWYVSLMMVFNSDTVTFPLMLSGRQVAWADAHCSVWTGRWILCACDGRGRRKNRAVKVQRQTHTMIYSDYIQSAHTCRTELRCDSSLFKLCAFLKAMRDTVFVLLRQGGGVVSFWILLWRRAVALSCSSEFTAVLSLRPTTLPRSLALDMTEEARRDKTLCQSMPQLSPLSGKIDWIVCGSPHSQQSVARDA